jgi:hypothetical protein
MAINTSKVIVGGLIGGVVANIIDFGANYFMADMQKAAMDALNPTLAANAMQPSKIPMFVVLDLVWILANMWVYAAIRPRFGPGPRTATYAAVASWVIGATPVAFFAAAGMFSWGFFSAGALVALINSIISTNVGARFYSEEPAAQGALGQTAYSS